MHNSLSIVGLLSVGAAAVVVTHPEYAREAGRRILPGGTSHGVATPLVAATAAGSRSDQHAGQPPDPLVGAIVHPSGEAGRLLGLTVPDAAIAQPASTAQSAQSAIAVTMNKVSTSSSSAVTPGSALSREQRDAASYLSRKYRVNGDAVAMLVDAAYKTGKDLGLDPLLLLSVMGVESGFNPFAESTAGASGLMQLIAKVHRDKLDDFGGAHVALNPVVNLRVGAVVLKDCIRRGGSVADGLRLYVGAGNGVDGGYGARVLQEKDKLAQAVHDAGRPRVEPRPERRDAVAGDEAKSAHSAHEPAQDFNAGDRADDKAGKPDADRAGDLDHGRFDDGRVAAL